MDEKEIKYTVDTLKVRIGMLRQWLNEDRIKDADKFVTNEELEYWLLNPSERTY